MEEYLISSFSHTHTHPFHSTINGWCNIYNQAENFTRKV